MAARTSSKSSKLSSPPKWRTILDDIEITGFSDAMNVILRMTAPLAAATLIIGGTLALSPAPATAKPEFAAKTGFPCGQCHVSPTGGGTLKTYGEAFKANGFEVPKKKIDSTFLIGELLSANCSR